jgi:N-methylhydantoinase A
MDRRRSVHAVGEKPLKMSPQKRSHSTPGRSLAVGIDTGGTFTDVVFRDGPVRGTYKLLSTPDDPGRAVIEALQALFGERTPDRITYGTTVATNAMLESRGARTALVTTAGFEDVLEIGRQARPDLYDLEPAPAEPLVPGRLRLGISERTRSNGTIAAKPSRSDLAVLKKKLASMKIESIAVCLLHAHVEPANERAVARALGGLGVSVSVSHELSPAPGEFERAATASANAYVRPIVEEHISTLARETRAKEFRVMQSNGGAIGTDTACREPVRTMLSGPAGGVAAAAARGREASLERLITFDMGGTSTDVALVDREIPRRTITEIAGIPVRSPCVDIHTVGAGGGSIARVDAGGALRVGPESAGADPGPACYGRGTAPTVTDANVVLGRLRPEAFLGGNMELAAERSLRALTGLARDMGVASAAAAAEGVVRVVEGTMERAIRVITVERGQDPRTCTLVAFGGAAGLHACGLAAGLGVERVLIPADPGLLSAWGVIDGPVVRDRSVALALASPTFNALTNAAGRPKELAVGDLRADGVAASRIRVRAFARLRYLGQALELEVPLARDFRTAFDAEHERLFHTSDPGRPLEATGIRVTATEALETHGGATEKARVRRHAARKTRKIEVFLDGKLRRAGLYERETLEPGARIAGPAILTEYSSTHLVSRGWSAELDAGYNLRLKADG